MNWFLCLHVVPFVKSELYCMNTTNWLWTITMKIIFYSLTLTWNWASFIVLPVFAHITSITQYLFLNFYQVLITFYLTTSIDWNMWYCRSCNSKNEKNTSQDKSRSCRYFPITKSKIDDTRFPLVLIIANIIDIFWLTEHYPPPHIKILVIFFTIGFPKTCKVWMKWK